MLYSKFIKEVIDLVIVSDEASGHVYLNPNYKVMLIDADLAPDKITDYPMSWSDLKEVLELEVERQEKEFDNSRNVVDWVYQIITATIEPTMVSEENELMKNMMEYMKLNHELKEREAEIERKEDIQEKKGNIVELMPGMNFSKRGTK